MAIITEVDGDGITLYRPNFYVKVNGKREQIRKPKFKTKAEVKAFIVDTKSKAQKGEYLPFLASHKIVTMQAVADNYANYRCRENAHTYIKEQSIVRRIVNDFGPEKDASVLRLPDFNAWIDGQVDRGLQKQSANKYRTSVKSMFREAVKAGLLSVNHTLGMKRFVRADKEKDTYFTDEEYFKLIDLCDHPERIMEWPKKLQRNAFTDLKDIIIIFRNTGWRCSDAERIRIEDIDFNLHTIRYTDQKNKEVQTLSMHPEAENRIRLRMARLGRTTGLIFYAHMNYWSGQFTRLVKAAGLYQPYPKNKTLHSLRHSFGTYLQKEYKDINATGRAMRHKTPKMTQRYAHVSDEMLRSAIVAASPKRPATGDMLLEEIKK